MSGTRDNPPSPGSDARPGRKDSLRKGFGLPNPFRKSKDGPPSPSNSVKAARPPSPTLSPKRLNWSEEPLVTGDSSAQELGPLPDFTSPLAFGDHAIEFPPEKDEFDDEGDEEERILTFEAGEASDDTESDHTIPFESHDAVNPAGTFVLNEKVLAELGDGLRVEYPDVDGTERNVVRVTSSMHTANRKLESEVGTDVVVILGKARDALRGGDSGHTRYFEAVGDYVPNLAVVDGGEITYVDVPRWYAVGGDPRSVRCIAPESPRRKGWTRYVALNGKRFDVKNPAEGILPTFVLFPERGDFLEYDVRAYREDITLDELQSRTKLLQGPRTQEELFEKAVKRKSKVEEVRLWAYATPSPDVWGGNLYKSWMETRRGGAIRLKDRTSASYHDSVARLISQLEALITSPSELAELEFVKKQLGVDPTEEKCKRIYLAMLALNDDADGGDPDDDDAFHVLPAWYEDPDSDDLNMKVPAATCTHVCGMEQHFDVAVGRDLPSLAPLFWGPGDAHTDTLELLAHVPDLALKGEVRAVHGELTESFPYYARSVTPRKPSGDRGTHATGHLWYERMSVEVSYSGVWFLPGARATAVGESWAIALDTAIIHDLLRGGSGSPYPTLYRPRRTRQAPLVPIPAYPFGCAELDDEVRLGALLEDSALWRSLQAPDARLHLPESVLNALTAHSDIFRFTGVRGYLKNEGPLRCHATVHGEEKEVIYTPGMTFNEKAENVDDAFHIVKGYALDVVPLDMVPPAQAQSEPVPPARPPAPPPPASKPPKGGKKPAAEAKTVRENPPQDLDDAGWQVRVGVARVPHASIVKFADALGPVDPGDWAAAFKRLPKMTPASIGTEALKHAYTVCWSRANVRDWPKHPWTEYHNPLWYAKLKGTEYRKDWWSWPTAKMPLYPFFATDNEGRLPLYGRDAVIVKKKREREARTDLHLAHVGPEGLQAFKPGKASKPSAPARVRPTTTPIKNPGGGQSRVNAWKLAAPGAPDDDDTEPL